MHTDNSFLAQVRFLTTDEGGRRRAPRNPAISQLALMHVQLSCRLVAVGEDGEPLQSGELALGDAFTAWIVIDHARHYASELAEMGTEVELVEGPKLVATGVRLSGLKGVPEAVDSFMKRGID